MQHSYPNREASFYLRNSLYKEKSWLLLGWTYHLLLDFEVYVFKQGTQDLAIS